MSNTPERNLRDLRVEVTTQRGDDQDRVMLRISDDASGTTLASVAIDTVTWWRLCQGGTAVVPGIVSPHLDRVGKRMENRRVDLPPAVEGDTDRDIERDVWRAVHDQLPEDWWTFDAHDKPRVQGDGSGQRYTIVRRWVAP